MNAMIESKRAELAELCRRAGVERLYLFGSAAQGRFRARSSDFDFLVEMSNRRPDAEYADRFLAFADALEHLFGRPDGVLLRPLPYEEPDRLVRMWEVHPGAQAPVDAPLLSNLTYHAWSRSSATLQSIGAFEVSTHTSVPGW